LLADGKPEEKRDFLKKVGSNLLVAEKRLSVEFKNPWKIMAEFNSAHGTDTAACGENGGNSLWRCLLAEVRTFFENTPVPGTGPEPLSRTGLALPAGAF
jgi:hypothetical protein